MTTPPASGRHRFGETVSKEYKRSSAISNLQPEGASRIYIRKGSMSIVFYGCWCRITTDPAFLAAHARRRPLEVLLRTAVTVRPRDYPDDCSRDDVVDTIPVSADQAGRRRLIEYPYTIRGTSCKSLDGLYYSLVASSCHGVLLLRISRARGGTDTFHICKCNPVTRQWTELPRLPELNRSVVFACGFYYHQPSGDFRLLCRCNIWTTMEHIHYVLSTGATEPRVVSMAGVDEAAAAVMRGVRISYKYYPVALHGRLHWLSFNSNMLRLVAFDTTLETFHLMTPPPCNIQVRATLFENSKRTKLFAMDGLLAVAEFGDMRIGLWFLQEYGSANERWECRHQLANPPMLEQQPRVAHGTTCQNTLRVYVADTDDEGDIILGTIQGIVAYKMKTKMWRVVESTNMNGRLCHIFRESLVQHQCFEARPSNGLPSIKFS
ncbi:hypothetical protein EJB05_56096, partial [Eragrostis curvula]